MDYCSHKIIHTERLFKNPPSDKDLFIEYVIEKICADCGYYFGTVNVQRRDINPNKTTKEETL